MKDITNKTVRFAVLGFTLAILASSFAGSAEFEFKGSRAETLKFMEYYAAIELTPAQEAIRVKALENMPAPCCGKFPAATCCCECNLSRSMWGLAKHLIAEEGADAKRVRRAVDAWVSAIAPAGHNGHSCPTGRCGKGFKDGGCGGMRADKLID